MLLFSRTIDYCFLYCFWIFSNLISPKQGIKMQIFFPNGFVETLKEWAPPHQVTFKCPTPPPLGEAGENHRCLLMQMRMISHVFNIKVNLLKQFSCSTFGCYVTCVIPGCHIGSLTNILHLTVILSQENVQPNIYLACLNIRSDVLALITPSFVKLDSGF